MNNRIKELRALTGMNQSDFASKIGIGQAGLSAIEKGIRKVTDRTLKDICREFNVDEEWLRTGNGEMFKPVLEEDEMARYVEELLYDTGGDSVFKLVKSIMRTYGRLDDKSKEVVRNSIDMLIEDIKKEG